jgi:hypothetical protein
MPVEKIQTLIIGGGQAGLTMRFIRRRRRRTRRAHPWPN